MRYLWLPGRVVAFMQGAGRARLPFETGGVLLGYQTVDAKTTVVTDVVGPGPGALHSLNGFSPDWEYQESEIAKAYAESGRFVVYLGDWHTHPNGRPELSWRDRRTLRRISSYSPARLGSPVMLVVAGWERWTIAGWQYSRSRWAGRVIETDVIIYGR